MASDLNRGAWSVGSWTIMLLAAATISSAAHASEPLPGTVPLTLTGDPASLMVAGIDRFLDRQTELALARRPTHWKRDFSSAKAYEASLAPNRARLRKILGVVDERLPCKNIEVISMVGQPAIIGDDGVIEIRAVRWPVLPGVDGEGLLLSPKTGEPVADCIVLPDCDTSPEGLIGWSDKSTSEGLIVRALAQAGIRVLVPALIDRHSRYSVIPGKAPTGQPHREWIYRQAFEMGRHIQGYEVQKVLAAAEWFRADRGQAKRKLGLIGFGEGGTIALAAGAIDTAIDAVCISGAFHSRQKMWEEPIDHNIWGFLTEFGDAELAAMIAPRSLTIEAAPFPSFSVPATSQGKTPGKLETPVLTDVEAEFQRAVALAGPIAPKLGFSQIASGTGLRGSVKLGYAFLPSLIPNQKRVDSSLTLLKKSTQPADFSEQRQKRQFDQLVEFTQKLVRQSDITPRISGPRPIANRGRLKPGKSRPPPIAITLQKKSSASSTIRCCHRLPRAGRFTSSQAIEPMKYRSTFFRMCLPMVGYSCPKM